MRRAITTLAALSTVLPSFPLYAKDALPLPAEIAARTATVQLKPAGPWSVDYADSKCRLQRPFDLSGQGHVLQIEQEGPQNDFQMVAAGPALAKLGTSPDLAWGLRSDLPLTPEPRKAMTDVPELGPAVFVGWATLGRVNILMTREGIGLQDLENKPNADGVYLSHGEIDPTAAAKVERIVFTNLKDGAAVSFETGNMKGAFEALNACTADLLTSWGLDPAQHRSYKPPHFLNTRDAFELVMRKMPRGLAVGHTLDYRLIVEADGTVLDCDADAEDNVKGAARFCEALMRQLKMAPARDAEGKPMRSFFNSSVSLGG